MFNLFSFTNYSLGNRVTTMFEFMELMYKLPVQSCHSCARCPQWSRQWVLWRCGGGLKFGCLQRLKAKDGEDEEEQDKKWRGLRDQDEPDGVGYSCPCHFLLPQLRGSPRTVMLVSSLMPRTATAPSPVQNRPDMPPRDKLMLHGPESLKVGCPISSPTHTQKQVNCSSTSASALALRLVLKPV